MLEDLKDKLNNSIEKMKQLLPEKFRGKSQEDEYEDGEEYEEYEEDEVEEGLVSVDDEKTAQHDISQLENEQVEGDEEEGEDDEEEDEDEEDELSDEEKKKKQKQLIIRIVVGVLAVYMIADEFLLKPSEEEVAIPTEVQRPKRKPKPVKKEEIAKPVEQEKPSGPIAEPVVQEEIKIPDVSNVPKEEVEKVEVVEDKKEDVPIDLELAPKEVEEVKSEDEVVESEKVEEVPPAVGESEVEEVVPVEKGATNLEDKLSEITEELENKEKEVLEYTPAPNYEDYGKGLVYNCKDKHWACVDRKPYLQCEMNYKWSKQNGKIPECSIEKTYADFKSCRIVQIHYINTIKEAPDCQ